MRFERVRSATLVSPMRGRSSSNHQVTARFQPAKRRMRLDRARIAAVAGVVPARPG